MHTFGGQVLRPFSNQPGGGAEPFGSRMRAVGDSVRNALSTQPGVQYQSETGAYLYKAYGCFDDGMFLQYNLTVPALTIEVEGGDFVSPQSSIRPVGENIYLGLCQFAHEALEYSKFVEEAYTDSDSYSDDGEFI
ncbi:Carboxypeptidase [Phytophthora palmivora]|uniref:Carboxypeptidase n=1 Tax=Phytophthora palmivora TaxID=4796 RepID=A0A2P4XHT2_9STRA|nr:Carboxypeptidase [Phytophthora palmivora]